MRDHPRARANGYVLEHILVAEKELGLPLTPEEEVNIKTDNDPDNLVIYKDHLEHGDDGALPGCCACPRCGNLKKSRRLWHGAKARIRHR